MREDIKNSIVQGNTSLGIEFGSTRIKAILTGPDNLPIAAGGHDWENRYQDNIWTYSLDDIRNGLQDCYQKLAADVKEQYGVALETIGAIGFSGMMHGYMAFNEKDELLVPFRTWRNNITGEASEKLTEEFQYHIPQRWSIAHLYQAILNNEAHVKDISFITTLAGYIHWKLTGEKVLGVGEASGVFPIDIQTGDYDKTMIEKFSKLVADKNYAWDLESILPKVLSAGEAAGVLSAEGAKLLDPTGTLKPGIPMCPPEGDAGTGMAATNSVAVRTGNVSAGTSVFAMVVLEKELSKVHPEIDLVTTPTGKLVAMVHANNCTSDLNSWVGLFKEFCDEMGIDAKMSKIYDVLYYKAMTGDADCGGLMAYNYLSGEHITGFRDGCPMFMRSADSKFNLANFMRTHLYTALGALKTGLDILFKQENVQLEQIVGHGGWFKTQEVGLKTMTAAINVPVSVMDGAGEGGAWGIALLASYMKNKKDNETLDEFLADRVFAQYKCTTMNPDPADVAGFDTFIRQYHKGLDAERAATAFFGLGE